MLAGGSMCECVKFELASSWPWFRPGPVSSRPLKNIITQCYGSAVGFVEPRRQPWPQPTNMMNPGSWSSESTTFRTIGFMLVSDTMFLLREGAPARANMNQTRHSSAAAISYPASLYRVTESPAAAPPPPSAFVICSSACSTREYRVHFSRRDDR